MSEEIICVCDVTVEPDLIDKAKSECDGVPQPESNIHASAQIDKHCAHVVLAVLRQVRVCSYFEVLDAAEA